MYRQILVFLKKSGIKYFYLFSNMSTVADLGKKTSAYAAVDLLLKV